MGLLDWFRSNGGNDGNDRPARPEGHGERAEKTLERTKYEAVIEYRNGKTESFECYGIYSRGENLVKFNTDPYGRQDLSREASYSYDRRTENYEVLACEPVLGEIGTDRFVIEYTVEYDWKRPRMPLPSDGKEWVETHTDIELTVEPA
jgi:hypothetical protein